MTDLYSVQLGSEAPDTPMTALQISDASSGRWLSSRQPPLWTPPTDVFEMEDCLVVLVEVAGMRDDTFSVTLNERRLTVSGTRQGALRELRAYQQMEIRYGEFRSEVILPWLVNREQVSAIYRDGLLRVELPRAPGQQIRIVDVEQEADDN